MSFKTHRSTENCPDRFFRNSSFIFEDFESRGLNKTCVIIVLVGDSFVEFLVANFESAISLEKSVNASVSLKHKDHVS